jgi:hypothetical protein
MGAAAVVVEIIMHHSRRRVPMGAVAVVVFLMHHSRRRVPMGAAAVVGIARRPLLHAGPNGCRGSSWRLSFTAAQHGSQWVPRQ